MPTHPAGVRPSGPSFRAFHPIVPWLLLGLLALAGTGFVLAAKGRRPARSGRAPVPLAPAAVESAPVSFALAEPAKVADEVQIADRHGGRPGARERASARPPAGILRSPGGTTYAEATLAWTVLLPELEGRSYLREVDPERVHAVTVTTTSDAAGRFAFDAAPAELGEGPSVVWVTHAGHAAGRVAFESAEERERWSGAIELEERAAVRVRVTRAGEPVAGARVRHQLSWWGSDPLAAERRLRRAFLRELESGADGTLALVPGAGDNAIQAFLGDESSLLSSGDPQAALELELLPSIEVRGQLSVVGTPVDPAGARYRVAYFGAEDRSDLVHAHGSVEVRADGSFGPDRWPRAERERIQVSVADGEIVGVDADYANPAPGGSVLVELSTRRGYTLDALVRDTGAAPLAEAFVHAFRPAGDGWAYAARTTTDAGGRATLRGLPAGALWLDVGKPGHVTLAINDHRSVLPRAEEGPLAVVLAPAGGIAGRVTKEGEPVKRFTLFGWTSDRSFDVWLDREDEEGRFRIENAPLGKALHLFAFTSDLPQSETVVVQPGEEREIELALPEPRRARGRIVDTLTGAPVATATILHATSGLTGLATPRGKPMRVGPDGRFELDGFFPGRGGFTVRAAGYEPLHYSTREDDSDVIDVGLVPLNPLCTLEVYVREDGVADYSGHRAWNACNDDRTPVPLRPDGTLELVSNTGRYLVHLARPDGSVLVEGGVATPGSVEVVEFDLAQGIELTVVVRDPPAGIEHARLTAWWRAGDDEQRSEGGWSRELEAFVLRGLGPGPAVLQLVDAAGASLGQRAVRLAERERQAVELELGGARRRIRLVDARREPWASCVVHASLGDGSGWYATVSTDAAGEIELGPLAEQGVVLSARLGNEGLAYGIAVELEPDPARTTVVTLQPGGRSRLRLLELGKPQAGVHVAYRSAGAPHAVEFTYASDEQGLVEGPFCVPGTYELRINHRDFWPARPLVRIDGASEPRPVELFGLGELELTLAEPGGRPIPGARLELVHRELGETAADWIRSGLVARPENGLASDADGRLVLRRIPRGTYAWKWTAPSGETTSGELVLAPRGHVQEATTLVLDR